MAQLAVTEEEIKDYQERIDVMNEEILSRKADQEEKELAIQVFMEEGKLKDQRISGLTLKE